VSDDMVLGAVGYLPHGPTLDRPMDRRRFPRFARERGIPFDLVSDWNDHKVVVLSPAADLTTWVHAPPDRLVVFDLPDAYLDERPGPRRALRGIAKWIAGESSRPALSYRHLTERMLERADAVVCSTEEQAANIGLYNSNVHPILDLHGEIDFLPPVVRDTDQIDIVWEGLPATLQGIRAMLPALRSLSRNTPLRLHLVTDLAGPRYMNRFVFRRTEEVVADWGIDIRLHQWSVQTLTEVAGSCDLAIVPVDATDPMAVGKPENRMRIFWRLGVPVVVSANPAHMRAAELAGLGDRVVCFTAGDWERTLVELSSSPDLRMEVALAGQAAARAAYSDESLAMRWDRVIESLQR
jgi:hypothetical protein